MWYSSESEVKKCQRVTHRLWNIGAGYGIVFHGNRCGQAVDESSRVLAATVEECLSASLLRQFGYALLCSLTVRKSMDNYPCNIR